MDIVFIQQCNSILSSLPPSLAAAGRLQLISWLLAKWPDSLSAEECPLLLAQLAKTLGDQSKRCMCMCVRALLWYISCERASVWVVSLCVGFIFEA